MSFLAVLLSAGILTRMTESGEDIFKQWQRGHLSLVEPVVPSVAIRPLAPEEVLLA